MMNTEKEKTDIFKDLFSKMPEETLPASFRVNVMQQIMQESIRIKKRNERLSLMAVILASLGILSLAVASFFYLGLPEELSMPKLSIPKIDPSAFHFYLLIGGITLFLLFLDYRLRRLFHKDE